MLLRFAMLTLICALMAGVFGYEAAAPSLSSAAAWARILFVPFLTISVASLTGGTLGGRLSAEESLAEDVQERDHQISEANAVGLGIPDASLMSER